MSTEKKLYTEVEAARFLGFTPSAIKHARSKGILAGVPSPKFVKLGTKSVRYRIEDLNEWVEKYAVSQEDSNAQASD